MTGTPAFEREWYTTNYPDVLLSGIDPEEHYNKIGKSLGRLPCPPTRLVAPAFEYLGEHSSAHKGPATVLAEGSKPNLRFQGTLAVHVHLFHLDMLPECIWWLSSVPVPFDLYVSISDASFLDAVEQAFVKLPRLHRLTVEQHPNRGRDIAPMVAGFGKRLARYDFIAHFHSKKSSHTHGKRDWGMQLGHHLLHSSSHASRLLNLFADQPRLGLIFPVYHPSINGQVKWGGNLQRSTQELMRLMENEAAALTEADLLPFPAGSFFFARTKAINCILDGAYTFEDFEPEAGQVDGTLAHAIERLLVLVATRTGHSFRQIRAAKAHSLGRAYLQGDAYHSEVLEAIATNRKPTLPLYRDTKLAGVRIAVFSCSTGGYDRPLPFEAFIDGANYIFFTDQETSVRRDGHWQLTPLALTNPHAIKTARQHKSQPHKILEDVDIAIWVDGNLAITGDVTPWIAQVIQAEASFGVIPHPYRESVAAELAALKRYRIDDPQIMQHQFDHYRDEGFPDEDRLTETNFIIMNLRRPEARRALDIWWNEIKNHSRRDQLSFDYACWKAGASKMSLLSTGLSARADPHFAYFDHGGTRHPYLNTMSQIETLWASPLKLPESDNREDRLTVDAVVCVHNSPDDVARCLHSLALARDARTRLIIIDDGSEAPAQAVIARHMQRHPSDIMLRHEQAKGYTKSANVGMRLSRADYVVLLNSDTIVPQGWAEVLVRAGEANPKVGIVGPLSNAASWQSVPETLQSSGDFAVNDLPEGMSVDEAAGICAGIPAELVYTCPVVNGFCFAIKRQVIDAIGYLDEENFPQGYGEENDYCLRLFAAGFTCGFTLSTYVFHAKSKSFSHERRKVLSQEGWQKLVSKHGKEVLSAAVKEMQYHPAFEHARAWFSSQSMRYEPASKAIGFYLPQFHNFPINDIAWGPGFSEWRNVVKARPRFESHAQPRLPGELGYYDLRAPETLIAQGELAQAHGLYGMAIYYYRFGRERVMALPTDRLLATPNAKLRFFYCWANEDWTRAWDGRTSEVILQQDYSDETLRLIAADFIEALADTRYIRIDGLPVFMIYQLNRLPSAAGVIDRLRELVREALGIEIIVGTTWNADFRPEWEKMVDFIAQFPPHRTPRISKRELLKPDAVPGASQDSTDFLESYDAVVAQSTEAMDCYTKLVPGVCPDWDNSARRARQANILIGSTPKKFETWTRAASEKSLEKFGLKKIPAPFIFVNAWNEWAEGAVLEPTERDGRAYLRALRRGVG